MQDKLIFILRYDMTTRSVCFPCILHYITGSMLHRFYVFSAETDFPTGPTIRSISKQSLIRPFFNTLLYGPNQNGLCVLLIFDCQLSQFYRGYQLTIE